VIASCCALYIFVCFICCTLLLSQTMAQYGKSDYWNERYTRETDPFDWYQRYDALGSIFKKYMKPTDKILVVGCGNSRLSEDMYKDGYKNITNIDISGVVIKAMEQKHKDYSGMTYKVMDVTSMPEYAAGSFDVIIDKGTLDAVLCGEGSVSSCDKMLSEISRVLKAGGTFLMVTYAEPETRLRYLEKPKCGWRIEMLTIEKPKVMGASPDPKDVHYIYIMTRLG